MSKQKVEIAINGNSKSFQKSVQQAAKEMGRLEKTNKKTKISTKDYGDSVAKAASQIAIFRGQLDPVTGRISAFATVLRSGISPLAAFGLGITALAIPFGIAFKKGAEFEQQMLRTNALLEITGNTAGVTAKEMDELSRKFGMETLSSRGEGVKALQKLLALSNITGDSFERIIYTAQGAASLGFGSFQGNVENIGKALNDPIRNINRLATSMKIELAPEIEAQIKQFAKYGETVKAQALIFDVLGDKFSEFSKKEATLLAGKVDSLGEKLDHMFVAIGQTEQMKAFIKLAGEGADKLTEFATGVEDVHLESLSEKAKRLRQELEDMDGAFSNFNLSIPNWILNSATEDDRRAGIQQELRETIAAAQKSAEEQKNAQKNKERGKILEAEKGASKRLAIYEREYEKEAQASKISAETQTEKINRQYQERATALLQSSRGRIKARQDLIEAEFKLGKRSGDKQAQLDSARVEIENETNALVIEANERRVAKLAEIAEVEQKRDEAELQRKIRLKEKLIGIYAGNDGLEKLKANYDREKLFLEQAKITDETAVELGYMNKEALMYNYFQKLQEEYNKDVASYTEAEQRKIDIDAKRQAALDARLADKESSRFKNELDASEKAIDNDFGNIFFDLSGEEEKNAEIERLHQEHLDRILAMDISHKEKEKAIKEAGVEVAKKKDDMEAKSKLKASTDLQGALQTLGRSGNKKLFAISKAANMVQIAMNTATAVSNAYANIPPPMNIPAAIAIGAAGLVQLNEVKNQQMPQFHDGIDNVPRTGTYLIEKGERVVDRRLNADLKGYLSQTAQGNSGGNVYLQIPDTGNYNATEQWYQDNRNMIIRDLQGQRF